MHNKILGGIGMLWGGTILINELLDPIYGPGAYHETQIAACVFAGLMFFAGTYNLLK